MRCLPNGELIVCNDLEINRSYLDGPATVTEKSLEGGWRWSLSPQRHSPFYHGDTYGRVSFVVTPWAMLPRLVRWRRNSTELDFGSKDNRFTCSSISWQGMISKEAP